MPCQNAQFLKIGAFIFKVPKPPKKTVPEEVVPAPISKKVEPPPPKGRIILLKENVLVSVFLYLFL